MNKPVYDIPVTDSPGVPFGAPTAPPVTGQQLYSSPPPTISPDGDPVSGATPGTPSAAYSAPPTLAPEAVYPPPMSAPTMVPDMSAPAPAAAAPAPTSAPFGAPAPASPRFDAPAPTSAPAPFDAPAPFPAPRSEVPVEEIEFEILAPASASASPAASAPAPAPTSAPVSAAPAPSGPPQSGPVSLDEPPVARRRQPIPSAPETVAGSEDDVADLNPGTDVPDAALIDALHQVLLTGASDLHVSSGAPPMLRIDGHLAPMPDSERWDRKQVRAALFSLLSPAMRDTFDEKLELDWAYTLSANARFRANYYQDRGAMGAAFRIIPTQIKTLKELGIGDEVAQFSTLPRGLVLVTGPTGSGKSTTLAAMIDLVNETRRDHVVTVEDPIEFMHKNKKSLINQREVGRDTHSFGNALKHVLRQDPDVILIGELRDLETISIALTAAETGHLVFATLHTQSAPTTIDRVIDVFPPHQQDQVRTQLAATLQGVVCQTLVKKASGSGRAVATEVMFTTPAISNLVREGKTYQITSVLQSGSQLGMHTMDQALAELVNDGSITRAVAMEKSQDPETLERLIQRVDMAGSNDQAFVNLDFAVDSLAKQAQQGGRH